MSHFRNLGFGLGLRSAHYQQAIEGQSKTQWFEVISENFMGLQHNIAGRPIHNLLQVREKYPVVLHGVSLSIGSADPINFRYLHSLKKLAQLVEPEWISDHVCWTGVHGYNSHDLLPLPYTDETIQHVANRVLQVQDFLKRPLVLENVSSYIEFQCSQMTEWEFLSALTQKTGCRLLLDLNNIHVSAFNHGYRASEFIKGIPADSVQQFHLAGPTDEGDILVDTHDHPVPEPVWELYRQALTIFGPTSTIIERDANIPPLEELEAELDKARFISHEVFSSKGDHVYA